jgi:hypothetical protein
VDRGTHRNNGLASRYVDPLTAEGQLAAHEAKVQRARGTGTLALRAAMDGTGGTAWELKTNREKWRRQQQRAVCRRFLTRPRGVIGLTGGAGGRTGGGR